MNLLYVGDVSITDAPELTPSYYNQLFRSPLSFRAAEARCRAIDDHTTLDAEPLEGEGRPADVDERVDRPDLVEVDLLGRAAVHAPFGAPGDIRPVLAGCEPRRMRRPRSSTWEPPCG